MDAHPSNTDDRLRLNGQDGLTLTVDVGETRTDVRDGHNLSVIDWTGVYEGSGEAERPLVLLSWEGRSKACCLRLNAH